MFTLIHGRVSLCLTSHMVVIVYGIHVLTRHMVVIVYGTVPVPSWKILQALSMKRPHFPYWDGTLTTLTVHPGI
jgi:hypothetical protein